MLTKIPKFRRCVIQSFPFIEEDFDALTDYELLCKVVEYLNKVITSQNEVVEATEGLLDAFSALQTYVATYFENLDVQEEINNKLDQMAEDGTLQEIIAAYLQSNVTWTFDTVAEMKLATNLVAGSYAKTLGFYAIGDGGDGIYKITDTGTANEMDVIAVGSVFANLVIQNQTINIKQLGAIGDGVSNDTNVLTYALSTAPATSIKRVYLNEKYLITSTLNIASNKDIIGIKSNYQTSNYSPEIICESDLKFIDLTNKSNVLIENLNIKHINTQTADVIDLTRARYIKLENVKIYQPDNTIPCNAIAINDTNSTSDFSGYFEFNNVSCSYHKVGIKSRATYITLNNCNINHCSDYAVWYTGEGIGGINSCNITGEGVAVRYEGTYGVNISNSYLEGYYLNECVETTNNVPINITGCKIYQKIGTNGDVANNWSNNGTPQNYRNRLNSAIDGYQSFNNLTLNGNLAEEKFWGTSGTAVYKTPADLPEGMTMPNGFCKGAYYIGGISGNSAIYQEIGESFKAGETVTVGAWVYTVAANNTKRPLVVVGNTDNHGSTISASNAIVYTRPTGVGKWVFFTATTTLATDKANLGIKIQLDGTTNFAYITGICFCRGSMANLDSDYSPNRRKAIFDKMIIKGTDNNYYQLGYDGSNLTFTVVTHPEYN